MLRTVLSTIGLVEILAPEALIDAAEQIALANPEECELSEWVVPAARMEGLLFMVVMWRSDASYSMFKRFLGVIGILAVVHPRIYVEYSSSLAYTADSTPEWRGWVYPVTRFVGLLYLLIAFDELGNLRGATPSSPA